MDLSAGLIAMGVTLVVITAVTVAEAAVIDWLGHSRIPRGLRRVARLVERMRAARRPPPPAPLPVLHALELRRLSAELVRVEADNQPAKAARLAACRAAYDHVLVDYCRSLSVQLPEGSTEAPLGHRGRFAVEAALLGAGHDW